MYLAAYTRNSLRRDQWEELELTSVKAAAAAAAATAARAGAGCRLRCCLCLAGGLRPVSELQPNLDQPLNLAGQPRCCTVRTGLQLAGPCEAFFDCWSACRLVSETPKMPIPDEV